MLEFKVEEGGLVKVVKSWYEQVEGTSKWSALREGGGRLGRAQRKKLSAAPKLGR